MKKKIIIMIVLLLTSVVVSVGVVVSTMPEEPLTPTIVEEVGVDEKVEVDEETNTPLHFEKQDIRMLFKGKLPSETEISIDPHYEWISFGDLEEGVTLFPLFWDIESSLPDESFLVQVSFPFDLSTMKNIGDGGFVLSMFVYDFENKVWKEQESIVDSENQRVVIQVAKFSRYALGFISIEN